MDLLGELDTEGWFRTMTYRDRRIAKAERLREWADKRETKAEATFKANEVHTRDWAFNTQPGHIPARARIIAQEDRAHESLSKAAEFRSRADNIEAAAERAIYSDDVDAIERLEERIAELEAERARIKAYNASCRKGQRDLSLLDEKQQRDLASVAKYSSYQLGDNGAAPAYWLQNLGGNINRNKKRLQQLQQQRPQPVDSTTCAVCEQLIAGADYNDRHDNGKDEYHARCCPDCR